MPHNIDVGNAWRSIISENPFLTSSLEANFAPRGEFCPLEVKLSPGGEILCSPLLSSEQ
jgi:hypothetical protein